MTLPLLKDAGSLAGKTVLLRLDLNVPIEGGKVRDDFRIQKSLPTISFLQKAGAKVLILAHIESTETDSLKVVYEHLETLMPISFAETIADAKALLAQAKPGAVMLLENLRSFGDGEKNNDADFAREMALLGDVYVNDAFSVSHRPHASIVGIPKLLPHCAGLKFEEEYTKLSEAFTPSHPFVFILGGAKFDTKFPLVKKFLEKADTIFIGGALANDIFKLKGLEIGISIVSKNTPALTGIIDSQKLMTPSDVRVNVPVNSPKKLSEVLATDKILDAGPQTILELKKVLAGATFVLWNGPLGDYEKGFTEATIDLGKAIIESGAHSIVGGGDTLAVLGKAGLLEKFSFVSTAGGAMLDFLANETLVGIEVLK